MLEAEHLVQTVLRDQCSLKHAPMCWLGEFLENNISLGTSGWILKGEDALISQDKHIYACSETVSCSQDPPQSPLRGGQKQLIVLFAQQTNSVARETWNKSAGLF